MILDSCFLIDVIAGDGGATAKRDELVASGRPTAVAAPTVTEVERGLSDGANAPRIRSLLGEVEVVPYDYALATRAADVLSTLDDRGEPIGTLDAMVAATALGRGEPVVTRNVTEFDRVDGLTVSPY